MHHEVTKALWDSYAAGEKGDFFMAYIYLRYLHHMVDIGFETPDNPRSEVLEKLDDNTEELVKAYLANVGEGFMSADTNIYHSKVVKLQDALKLVTQQEDLNLSPSEKVIPFKLAKDVILANPESIAVGTCPCRLASAEPCLPDPMEVCLFVGDPYASFIAEQNPRFRRIGQDEAVEILEDCHERGLVHSAYFKKEMHNSFFAICNCCSCCCGGVKMWNLLDGQGIHIAPSGYVAEVREDCNGCGICAENVCNFNAISMDEVTSQALISFDKCMGCGVCEDMCLLGAIGLRRDPAKGEPLDIEELKGMG
jgi:ferredoxin